MRLGDLDALKEEISSWGMNDYEPADFIDAIDATPTVEIATTLQPTCNNLQQKPQGEWIDYNNTFYKCPDCGYLLEKCCPQCQNKVILPKGGAE